VRTEARRVAVGGCCCTFSLWGQRTP
jgi:hypothetical protein